MMNLLQKHPEHFWFIIVFSTLGESLGCESWTGEKKKKKKAILKWTHNFVLTFESSEESQFGQVISVRQSILALSMTAADMAR